jgi:protein-glutamine gamma-glutamyltransferase
MSRTARATVQPGDDAPSRLAVSLCLTGFASCVLLNAHHLAWWSTLLALATAAWRARAAWSTHQLPGRAQRITLVILLTLAVIISFRSLNGIAAGATLLAAMIAAKLLETRRTRDWYIVIGASLFLLTAACLDRQQLWRLPLYAGQLWLLATALRAVGSGAGSSTIRPLLRSTARSLGLALPLALVLFLFFPRLPGAFWALPQSDEAITGLGNEMSPGSISQLSESDETAMRVRFTGELPPPAERYWRGPVLHDFDGYTWRRHPSPFGHTPQLTFSGHAYHYDVMLEPSTHNVLIALELPQTPDLPYVFYSGDYQLISPRPLTQARNYSLVSYPQHHDDAGLSTLANRIDRELPATRNQRSVELAQHLRADARDEAAFVSATLDYFRNGGFEYTLTPPRLSLNSVDDFLFGARQGFCGHFASAFVTLMRAGGVPARVVTGYLGGEWNPVGGYLTIRQSHAHAWAEVWLEGRGWIRVDPTAVVAPERLTRDIFDLIGGAARAPGRMLRTVPWIGSAIQAFEALNAWWQDRVVGFDFRKQFELLDALGFSGHDWHALAMLLGGGTLLWLGWIAWNMRDQLRPVRRDPLARLWLSLDRKLARAGWPRAIHEGPLAYAARVGRERPALATELMLIARRYARLRFDRAAADTDAELRALRGSISRLQP